MMGEGTPPPVTPPGYRSRRVVDRVREGVSERWRWAWHVTGPGGTLELLDDDPDRDGTLAAWLADVLPAGHPMLPGVASAGPAQAKAAADSPAQDAPLKLFARGGAL